MSDNPPFAAPFLFAQNLGFAAGHATNGNQFFLSEAEANQRLQENAKKINKLQDRLFAEGSRSLLIILQGMDSSGKDGTIRSVFGETGPLGVEVSAFRAPSEEERGHDYLWRVHQKTPARGKIGIFNRSHYEDVLVVKVKSYASPEAIELRYQQINDFERMLTENGTHILKFMLNLSFEEQAKRLQARIDDKDKRWKFNPSDLDDRALWPQFMAAYDIMLARTSTDHAPWHVIPSDQKWARNSIISQIVRDHLERMNPNYPEIKKPAIMIT